MKHYFERLQSIIVSNWERKALCDYRGDSFTFGEMYASFKKMHILFESFGVHKGDKIAICGKNQARWAVSFLSVNTYEAVVVPVLADFMPENICSIVTHSESIVLFTDPEIWKKLDISAMPSVRQVISISDFSLLYGSEDDRLAVEGVEFAFRKKYLAGFSVSDVHFPTGNDKDLAVINYTSGSTGDPKGVMLRYECFSANTEYGQKNVPSYPSDNLLSILPMAHMFGMAFELIYPLCGGTTIYFLGKAPSPTILMKAMQEVRPYLVIAVPMVFEKIYRTKLKPELEKPAVKSLVKIPGLRGIVYSKMRRSLDAAFGGKVREYIMGGAAVNPEVEEFLQRIGFHFTVGYGMTEAAPLLAYSSWRTFVLRSCGRAMDFVKLRIDSENPQNVVGEIQAKGISLFSGYFNNEKATKAAFTADGWFNTGDLGLIDKKGNVYIKGRSKSMLLSSNGQNIYPEEIECEINSLPYVIESLVVSREGKLVALVYIDIEAIRRDGKDSILVANDIKEAVNAKVPRYSQISKVEFEPDPFQKTPKMSIKRFLYK
uniref:AMP-dependent synthetase/ligase domain-containing protein n=1 Tax=uncultured bacterium pUR16A2 TaxID=1204710 RepID=R9R0A7_9BACT|nr:hypothetical protein [uncultured bacterium pUR16A2]